VVQLVLIAFDQQAADSAYLVGSLEIHCFPNVHGSLEFLLIVVAKSVPD
jgi:hypothetical protein